MRRRDARRDTGRRGFTLVEVIVALAVSGVVLLGARALLSGLADHADRLVTYGRATDREANAERLLRSLVAQLEVGTADAGTFGGTEREARFTTWCDVPAGWQERCEVMLAIDTLDSRALLRARLSTGHDLILRRGFRAGALRYLHDADAGGMWFHVWGTGVTAPQALGVILDRDTLILRIGERG
ncbi:MAG: type IV pilus modification PilV family protein [Steroidobacteraceae bacterium]